MLITNFAAGELSENLFGRIDIQQYYQGASRLENFDVIPTGGIKRRPGTERLLALEGEGRLIPFSADRQDHFLLYLTPGRIQVIKNGAVEKTAGSAAELSLYRSLPEIREVQYAQNFDTMILVHENYPPLMAKRGKETGVIDFSAFEINYAVETKASGAVSAYETDTANEKYLRGPGDYPRCVTFFNGRLVFAGTKNDPQRVFASRAGDIHSFAAYKLFITERREYISVFGNAFNGSDVITLGDGQAPKFVKPLDEYYCDAPYFPREYTKPLYFLEGDSKKLRLSSPAIIPDALSQQELDEINRKIALYNEWEKNKSSLQIGHITDYVPYLDIHVEFGAKNMSIFFDNGPPPAIPAPLPFALENNAAGYATQDYLAACIKETYLKSHIDGAKHLNEGAVSAAAAAWLARVQDAMRMNFRGEWLYDIPQNIWARIAGSTAQGIDSYMPFYTADTVKDRYASPDDGFTFEIASDMADAIRWIAVNKGVIIGTETAEWIIPPEVTATNLYAALNSRYGSDKIQGAAVDDAACFFQAGKKALAEYYIPQQDSNFRANNMALLSPAMLAESPAVEFDFTRAPYTKLFITREDGTAVTLLYERGTGTFAWGRFTTAGRIASAAVLPGADGNDDIYLAVERGGGYFLEALRESSGIYLDSYERAAGSNPGYTEAAIVHGGMIGYPYTSLMRSMPVVTNDKMKPSNIGNLYIRFADSYMPALRLPGGGEQRVSREEPYSGVEQFYFPGGHDRTLLFELVHDRPTRCRILAVYAEAN